MKHPDTSELTFYSTKDFWLAGGLMVGLDKQHQPEIKVFAGNKPVAAPAL